MFIMGGPGRGIVTGVASLHVRGTGPRGKGTTFHPRWITAILLDCISFDDVRAGGRPPAPPRAPARNIIM